MLQTLTSQLISFLCTCFSILSFGAPAANVYKIIVDGRDPMLFETSQVIYPILSKKNSYVCSKIVFRATGATLFSSGGSVAQWFGRFP